MLNSTSQKGDSCCFWTVIQDEVYLVIFCFKLYLHVFEGQIQHAICGPGDVTPLASIFFLSPSRLCLGLFPSEIGRQYQKSAFFSFSFDEILQFARPSLLKGVLKLQGLC